MEKQTTNQLALIDMDEKNTKMIQTSELEIPKPPPNSFRNFLKKYLKGICDECDHTYSWSNLKAVELSLYEELDDDPIKCLLKSHHCFCCEKKELRQYLYSEEVKNQFEDFDKLDSLRFSLILIFRAHKDCEYFFEDCHYEEYNSIMEDYERELKSYLKKYF